MSYRLHQALLGVANDLEYAFVNGDLGLIHRIIERDLATAYVVAKELEEHGYEAFCDAVNELNQGTPE